MSENPVTEEVTGSYQPPVPPQDGDDGYSVIGKTDHSGIKDKDPNPGPQPRMNANAINGEIQGVCDLVASWCDWNRDLFAKELVSYAAGKWTEFNWIICHSAHSYLWMGARGTDYEHWHYELDVWGAGTIGYELYWAKEGFFSLNGDGGFTNWAYTGNVEKLSDKALHFYPR
ncbi:hypothetical protein DFP72DRAFT_906294 [Ephemerocybe angulata]|uniref:Uncharacterized protein n=1 Tax=Ephemerocybe angulata TaxID=980116 RepID=A0A8H6HRH1_9AGAR|nr:hypothetical protein DFP72DRAFT_906294 [Tulosesus angulatus]